MLTNDVVCFEQLALGEMTYKWDKTVLFLKLVADTERNSWSRDGNG